MITKILSNTREYYIFLQQRRSISEYSSSPFEIFFLYSTRRAHTNSSEEEISSNKTSIVKWFRCKINDEIDAF